MGRVEKNSIIYIYICLHKLALGNEKNQHIINNNSIKISLKAYFDRFSSRLGELNMDKDRKDYGWMERMKL